MRKEDFCTEGSFQISFFFQQGKSIKSRFIIKIMNVEMFRKTVMKIPNWMTVLPLIKKCPYTEGRFLYGRKLSNKFLAR